MARASKPTATKPAKSRPKTPEGPAKPRPKTDGRTTTARTARHPTTAERERTLQAFRAALVVRTNESRMTPEQRARPSENETLEQAIERERARVVPQFEPVRGVPAGHVMAARWCTMVDAVHAIGYTLYGEGWAPSILDDKPNFPHTHEQLGFVFRRAAMEENGVRRSSSEPIVGDGEPPIAEWSHRPRDSSWDKALGAYAVLCEALAEGLVRAEAESIVGGLVPNQYDGNHHQKSLLRRGRVPIDAAEWRRDDVVMAAGLVRAWWSLGPNPTPKAPPWLVLIERETLNGFLERYAEVLTAATATDATRQRGRKRKRTLDEVEAWVVPRWVSGEIGPDMKSITDAIAEEFGAIRGTADHWRLELGIKEGVAPGEHVRAARK